MDKQVWEFHFVVTALTKEQADKLTELFVGNAIDIAGEDVEVGGGNNVWEEGNGEAEGFEADQKG